MTLELARKVLGRTKLLNPADPECSPEVHTEDSEKVTLAREVLRLGEENERLKADAVYPDTYRHPGERAELCEHVNEQETKIEKAESQNAALREALTNAANAMDEAANVLAGDFPSFARLIRDNAGFTRQALGSGE